MGVRSILSAILLVIGLAMVVAGVVVMVLNPIRIEVYHEINWFTYFEPMLRPPGEYRDVELSYTLSKDISFDSSYVELRLGKYRFLPELQFNVSSTQCIFLSRYILLDFHGAAPNRNGTLFIELNSCEDLRWGANLLRKTLFIESLGTEGSFRELHDVVAKGVIRLEKGELLIDFADIIPVENITDECIRVYVYSPDISIRSQTLSASIEERYRCNYTVSQPHLYVYPHFIFTPVPRDIHLESKMFTIGLSIAVIGTMLSILSLALQISQLKQSKTIDIEQTTEATSQNQNI